MTDKQKYRLKQVWIAECPKCGNFYLDSEGEIGWDKFKIGMKRFIDDGDLKCGCND